KAGRVSGRAAPTRYTAATASTAPVPHRNPRRSFRRDRPRQSHVSPYRRASTTSATATTGPRTSPVCGGPNRISTLTVARTRRTAAMVAAKRSLPSGEGMVVAGIVRQGYPRTAGRIRPGSTVAVDQRAQSYGVLRRPARRRYHGGPGGGQFPAVPV